MNYRIEKDTMGEVRVSNDKYWGAQTQRSLDNFKIGPSSSMPREIIKSFGYLKKAAAITNFNLGVLSKDKKDLIVQVCDEIIEEKLLDHFPLVIWQTGSGTQSNMNINEVISNRVHILQGNKLGEGKAYIHPNDDVNKSQSSNDTFPTAMNIAGYIILVENTIPNLEYLRESLNKKALEFKGVIKIGRTHMMDATPTTLGNEFSAYAKQIDNGIKTLKNSLSFLRELALGGTAVGTGLNAPINYDKKVAECIAELTGYPFITAENKFKALSSHEDFVEAHGALKKLAVSIMKIANDIRLMGSGPRSGIAELILPPNEPGSSIMPGKVNPTQVEAITMVCAQVMGNDVAISISDSQGHFDLNVFKPVIIYNFLQSARLLGDASKSFVDNCIIGIKPDYKMIEKHLNNSLMLITALNTHIGYDNCAKIAKEAHKNHTTLREEAIKSGLVTGEEYDMWVRAEDMLGPMKK